MGNVSARAGDRRLDLGSSLVSPLDSQDGMSLIEVMVASGLMLVLALGMATFFTHSNRDIQIIKDKASFTGLGSNLQMQAGATEAVRKSILLIDP